MLRQALLLVVAFVLVLTGASASAQEQLSGTEQVSSAVLPPEDHESGRGLITLEGPTGMFIDPTTPPTDAGALSYLEFVPRAVEYGYDMGGTTEGTSLIGPAGFYVTDGFAYVGVLPANQLPTGTVNVVTVQTASLRNGCEGLRREVSVSVARPGLPLYESDDDFVGNPGRGHNLVASVVLDDCRWEFFYLENVDGEYQSFQSRVAFFTWDDGRSAVTSFVAGAPTFSGTFSASAAQTTSPEVTREETFGFQSARFEFSGGEDLEGFADSDSLTLDEIAADPPLLVEGPAQGSEEGPAEPVEPEPAEEPGEQGPDPTPVEPVPDEVPEEPAEDPVEPSEENDESGGFPLLPIVVGGAVVAGGTTIVAVRRRRGRGEPGGDPVTETGPIVGAPAPPTAAERFVITYGEGGTVTPEQNRFKGAADTLMSELFDAPASGVWHFSALDDYVVDPEQPIPDGAEVVGFWDDTHGVVVETDQGQGTVITIPTAKLRYRFDADGRLLKPYAYDPTPAASFMEVAFYQDEGTGNIPVAYAVVWDADTRRVFTTATSRPMELIDTIIAEQGHPYSDDSGVLELDSRILEAESKTMEEAVTRVLRGAKDKGVAAEWAADPDHPLHRINRYLVRTLFVPVPADWEPPETVPSTEVPATADGEPDGGGETWRGDGARVRNVVAIKIGTPYDEYLQYRFDPWRYPHSKPGLAHQINRGIVESALDHGATATSDGWVPIDHRALSQGGWRPPKDTAAPGPAPGTFAGTLINRHTYEIIDRDTLIGDEDSEAWSEYRAICADAGIDPLEGFTPEEGQANVGGWALRPIGDSGAGPRSGPELVEATTTGGDGVIVL